ncbi:MAG: GNAT family N-acetyltransferase [Actinobacteria bacterium]|nr:GNAT family N-acetyltransferase [Actinomycetota bacterium]
MAEHTIGTDRLRLEPKREELAAASWHALERSLPELRRYMTWAATSDLVTTTEHMRLAESEWRDWTGWDWVIFLDDEVAGAIGLNRYDALWKTCNLGYWVRSDLAGQGIATEAGRAVVDFAFGTVKLHRLELVAAVHNPASNRVAEKLGFQFEGIKREAFIVDGRGHDARSYGLLATDPRPGI